MNAAINLHAILAIMWQLRCIADIHSGEGELHATRYSNYRAIAAVTQSKCDVEDEPN